MKRFQQFSIFLIIFISISCSTPQKLVDATKDEYIFKLGNEIVSPEEFIYQYNKTSTISEDIETESAEEYLNRYINFKLKVQYAKSLGRHEDEGFQKELNQYKADLAKPFLQDEDKLEELVDEYIERKREEVSASHILIEVPPLAAPEDTLEAWNQILEIKQRALIGAPFEALAQSYSEDPSAANNKGNLGYFSAMQMVYPFESAAYSLAKGQLSDPVRTRFGYHLIKLNDRIPARGEVKVAHIMLRATEGMPQQMLADQESKIKQIHQELIANPEMWSNLVSNFSDDISTKQRNGELDWIGVGALVPAFENVAFGLREINEISEPFKTPYGWHIVKLLEKRPMDEASLQRDMIRERVSRDNRSRVAFESFIENAAVDINLVEVDSVKSILLAQANSKLLQGNWKWDGDSSQLNQILYTTNTRQIPLKEAVVYIENEQTRVQNAAPEPLMLQKIAQFRQALIQSEYQSNLENLKPAYKWLVKEYQDGMLLFDIMEEMVWDKALEDTIGLQSFYELNKGNYRYEERAKATLFIASGASSIDLLKEVFETADSAEEIKSKVEKVLSNNPQLIQVRNGTFEIENDPYLSVFDELLELNSLETDDSFIIAVIDETLPPQTKELNEIRGQVISEYQEYLEEQWLNQLREEYPVVINKTVFNRTKEIIEKEE
ncbi:peptidylprolyl isomerase [Peijinzhouia sedimentorum]